MVRISEGSLVSSRELVMQKVSSCCRRGNQLSYKYSKVGGRGAGGVGVTASSVLDMHVLVGRVFWSFFIQRFPFRSTRMRKEERRRWSG